MMDVRAWAVAFLVGLLVGVGLARFRDERKTLLGATAAVALTGAVTWVVAPAAMAGPSMALGGAVAWLSLALWSQRGS